MEALGKIGKGLAGMIFKEDEAQRSQAASPAKPAGNIGGFAASAQGAAASGGAAAPVTLNQDMVEALKQVVTKRVSAFTTLEEKSNAMASAIPDETMRTKAAFGILAAEGRSAQDIIKAIEMHVNDVDSENTRFSNACNAAKATKSGGLRKQITELEGKVTFDTDLIGKLQQQIADAQGRIAANQQNISELSSQAAAADADIDSKVAQFGAAADAVKQSLIGRKNALSSVLA